MWLTRSAIISKEIKPNFVNNKFSRNLINSGRLSVPFKLGGLKLDNEFKDDPLLGLIYVDFPILDGKGNRLFLTDVITHGYNLLAFSKTKMNSTSNLNIINIGEESDKDVDFVDVEGRGLERYRKDLSYLIRPDGYITGIFKDVTFKILEKYML